MEPWKKIPGFGDHYEASPDGQIRRLSYFYKTTFFGKEICRLLPQKIFRLNKKSPKGYCRINLEGSVHFVHRLIAQTFLLPIEGKPQINHRNGIKTDNRVENLEWVSNQENRDHAVANNLIAVGSRVSKKLVEASIPHIRALAESGVVQTDIADQFFISQQTVSQIVRKATWKHV